MKQAIRAVIRIPAFEAVGPSRGGAKFRVQLTKAALRTTAMRGRGRRQFLSASVFMHVVRLRQYLKVFGHIVQLVMVFVVDYLCTFQRAAKHNFHYVPVFEDHPAVDADFAVAAGGNVTLAVARVGFWRSVSLPKTIVSFTISSCMMTLITFRNGARDTRFLIYLRRRFFALPLSIVGVAQLPRDTQFSTTFTRGLAANSPLRSVGGAMAALARIVHEAISVGFLALLASINCALHATTIAHSSQYNNNRRACNA